MAAKNTAGLRQICLTRSVSPNKLVSPAEADQTTRLQEREANYQSLLVPTPRLGWPHDAHLACCPHPMLVSSQFTDKLAGLHEALVLAINDIVARWWTDKEAGFPSRMPIEAHEESLLRWMDEEEVKVARPFEKHQGSWRPDFLIEHGPDQEEEARICEINARFALNGYLITAYGQQGLLDLGAKRNGFAAPANPTGIVDGLFTLFDPELPLHLLKGDEGGHDILMFLECAERRMGVVPRMITPQDLRLVVDSDSKTGYKLCCVVDENSLTKHPKSTTFVGKTGEVLEEIHQVGLELHQHELRALSPKMLRHIALRCFNDFRSIFLVHDKRMLGIIHQELDTLVLKRRILTQSQADILRRGIVHTILPGSPELKAFIQNCRQDPALKDSYILKPVRGGKGEGIVFGDDVSLAEWTESLGTLHTPELVPGRATYVVQRQVQQPLYEVLLREEDGVQHNRLVGTYMSVHGQYLGLGCWRSGPGRVCAISHGGAWMVSVTNIDK